MAKRSPAEQSRHICDIVFVKWMARTAAERESKHIENFSDDLWLEGYRLSKSVHGHYQAVSNYLCGHWVK